MGRLLIELWPVVLPVALFLCWRWLQRRRAKKHGHPLPRYTEGPWFWVWVSTLVIAIGCFILWWVESPKLEGVYVPAHMENGVLVPSRVEPK